jgi:hypothetical protein
MPKQGGSVSRKIKLYLSFAAVIALAASVPAASSATGYQFTASNPGALSSFALGNQVFGSFGNVTVECKEASGSMTLQEFRFTNLYLKVSYSNCTSKLFGSLGAGTVSPAEYTYNANGTLALRNQVTIVEKQTGCKYLISPQENLTPVTYTNHKVGEFTRVITEAAVSKIAYTSTVGGPICGESGTNGTLSGRDEVFIAGGGNLSWGPA